MQAEEAASKAETDKICEAFDKAGIPYDCDTVYNPKTYKHERSNDVFDIHIDAEGLYEWLRSKRKRK